MTKRIERATIEVEACEIAEDSFDPAFLGRLSAAPCDQPLLYASLFEVPPFFAQTEAQLYRALFVGAAPARRPQRSWLLPPLVGVAFVLGVVVASSIAHAQTSPGAPTTNATHAGSF
jgi:hypothetical protein